MTKEQLEAHLKECSKRHCWKCSKPFEIAEGHECHLSRCSFCAVIFDTGTEHTCVNWLCVRCRGRFALKEREQHECTHRLCRSCSARFPIGEAHECGRFHCMGCRHRVPWEHQARHLLECNKYRCPSCYVIVERDQLTEHQQVCAKMKCQVCKESQYKTEEDLHLAQCRGPRMEGWGPSQKSRSLPRLDPSQVTNIILASATKYPMPQGCMSTMTAWMEKPLNIAVADFEFLLFPDGTYFPLQVAIANGYGSWIVPRSTINHRVTKRALLEKANLIPVFLFSGS